MSGEGVPPQAKDLLELETAIGYRHIFDERGMPRIGTISLLVGFTIILVLNAVLQTIYKFQYAWLWWIPAGIFVFGLVMMSFFYLMMRRERAREERKGV